MTIFTEPDRTEYPPGFESISCPSLEQLTGVDMVISKLPLPPTANLRLHIKNHSLFVQIKIGYDICSFDQLHSSIARIQAAKIPKGQAILLPIGEYWQDENGLLRLKGQKAFGTTKYETLGTIYDMWEYRGGTVEAMPPKSIDDLQEWVDRKLASFDKIQNEGKREIYPPSPEFIPDDIWQAVEEINDWRVLFVSGLKGCGSKKVNALFDYVTEKYPLEQAKAYRAMCILTDKDEKGKYIHKIPLWGKVSRDEFRSILGIAENWNLPELAWHNAYHEGWRSFEQEFKERIEKGQSGMKAFNELVDKRKAGLENIEDLIPF